MSLNIFIPKQIRVLGSIRLKIKSAYGVKRLYAACEISALFAELLQTKTFSEFHISKIKALGYEITYEQN